MIFVSFKPIDAINTKSKNVDIALVEIKSFIMYELNKKGMISITHGSKSHRYLKYSTIKDLNYTDNSNKFMANIKAKDALYKNDIINLSGDVVYNREDNLVFKSQEAIYNQIENTISTTKKYILYQNKNIVKGSSLQFNNISGKIKSKNVVATYKY